MFPPSTLLDATTTRISPLIADTGATCTFLEMNIPCITNIKEADPGIDVLCPNNQFLISTYTADITYDHLQPGSKSAHIFRKLESDSLLSIGQRCDSSCEAF